MNIYNYASIDVGSNSINLLLALVKNKEILKQETQSFITELGKGLSKTGEFSRVGMENAFGAFSEINEELKRYQIPKENIVCVATEASRVAKNSKSFYSHIENSFEINTKIISPEVEAEFSIIGVVGSKKEELILIDLGGASTEIIYINKGEIQLFKSFKVGAVNVGDAGYKEKISEYVKNIAFSKKVVLVGGTAACAGALLDGGQVFNSDNINKLMVTREEFQQFFSLISSFSHEELKEKYPLVTKRINSFQTGVSRICEIVNMMNVSEISFSTNGVRQGALVNLIG